MQRLVVIRNRTGIVALACPSGAPAMKQIGAVGPGQLSGGNQPCASGYLLVRAGVTRACLVIRSGLRAPTARRQGEQQHWHEGEPAIHLFLPARLRSVRVYSAVWRAVCISASARITLSS